ncbi:hypothetical protein P9112_012127 [Eukaryota sp. TZLM1-RC]
MTSTFEEAAALVNVEHVGVEFDIGARCAFDHHPVPFKDVLSRSRDITQMLVNKLFSLPLSQEQEDVGRVVDLPKRTTKLPRAKPIPKPKPPTKWEEFAKQDRMVLDDVTGELMPRHGYKRAGTLADVAFIEAKPTDLPGSDPFTEAEQEKKDRVKRNKQNQLKNEKRNMTAGDKRRIALESAIKVTSVATASMGKFDNRRKGEPDHKRKNTNKVGSQDEVSFEEREKQKKVLGHILSKKDPIDKDRAANLMNEQTNRKRRSKR